MARIAVQNEAQHLLTHVHQFTFFERYVLRRAHPRSLFIEVVGLIWFIYFLWYQNLGAAITTIVFFRIVALASVWNVNLKSISETYLGKMALLHLNPMNVAIQLAGIIILIYGVWQHSTDLTLTGLSIVLLGHLFGWSKVDPRLNNAPNT